MEGLVDEHYCSVALGCIFLRYVHCSIVIVVSKRPRDSIGGTDLFKVTAGASSDRNCDQGHRLIPTKTIANRLQLRELVVINLVDLPMASNSHNVDDDNFSFVTCKREPSSIDVVHGELVRCL